MRGNMGGIDDFGKNFDKQFEAHSKGMGNMMCGGFILSALGTAGFLALIATGIYLALKHYG